MAQATATLSERRPADRDAQADLRCGMEVGRHPRRFAAEQEDVARLVAVVEVGGARLGREQHETQAFGLAPLGEGLPGGVSRELHRVEIVHSGAAEGAVAGRKPRRLDQMGLDAQAGRQPKDGAGVLGNIGLEKGDRHGGGAAGGAERAGATTASAAVRDPSSPLYKLPGTASLPGLRSAGKGANKRPTVALHNLVVRPRHLVPEC